MKGFVFLCGLLAVLCLLAIPISASAAPNTSDPINFVQTDLILQQHIDAKPIDPAMLRVDCAANGSCSNAARSRRWRSSTVQVTQQVTTQTKTVSTAQAGGPVRGAACAAGGRAAGATVAVGGRAARAVTAPVRWLRNRGGGGCGG